MMDPSTIAIIIYNDDDDIMLIRVRSIDMLAKNRLLLYFCALTIQYNFSTFFFWLWTLILEFNSKTKLFHLMFSWNFMYIKIASYCAYNLKPAWNKFHCFRSQANINNLPFMRKGNINLVKFYWKPLKSCVLNMNHIKSTENRIFAFYLSSFCRWFSD